MKDNINKYIPHALQYIKQTIANDADEVDERYDGYAASLGPAIITSGLLPAIAFYTDIHRGGDSTVKRYMILNIITSIMISDGVNIQNSNTNNSLLHHLNIAANNTPVLKSKILDAVVALKLAFRNFKQV